MKWLDGYGLSPHIRRRVEEELHTLWAHHSTGLEGNDSDYIGARAALKGCVSDPELAPHDRWEVACHGRMVRHLLAGLGAPLTTERVRELGGLVQGDPTPNLVSPLCDWKTDAVTVWRGGAPGEPGTREVPTAHHGDIPELMAEWVAEVNGAARDHDTSTATWGPTAQRVHGHPPVPRRERPHRPGAGQRPTHGVGVSTHHHPQGAPRGVPAGGRGRPGRLGSGSGERRMGQQARGTSGREDRSGQPRRGGNPKPGSAGEPRGPEDRDSEKREPEQSQKTRGARAVDSRRPGRYRSHTADAATNSHERRREMDTEKGGLVVDNREFTMKRVEGQRLPTWEITPKHHDPYDDMKKLWIEVDPSIQQYRVKTVGTDTEVSPKDFGHNPDPAQAARIAGQAIIGTGTTIYRLRDAMEEWLRNAEEGQNAET